MLKQRQALSEQARLRHPERWSRHTRNWTDQDGVVKPGDLHYGRE